MNSKKAFATLTLIITVLALVGCGGMSGSMMSSSNQIMFTMMPASAMAQMGSQTTINATNISNSAPMMGQVTMTWTIQEAAAAGMNCTQFIMTATMPPIPPGCAAFGALDVVMPQNGETPATKATFLAPNQSGMFHIVVNASLNTNAPGGPTGQQTVMVTVQ